MSSLATRRSINVDREVFATSQRIGSAFQIRGGRELSRRKGRFSQAHPAAFQEAGSFWHGFTRAGCIMQMKLSVPGLAIAGLILAMPYFASCSVCRSGFGI
jgi:hypothetical protein